MKKIPQDIVGTIAILKFPKGMWQITKKLQARKFLKEHKNIATVVEKIEGFALIDKLSAGMIIGICSDFNILNIFFRQVAILLGPIDQGGSGQIG